MSKNDSRDVHAGNDNGIEFNIDKDATAKITVDPDGMRAHIILEPPSGNGKNLTLQQIMDLIRENGVVTGIDEEKIKSLAENPSYLEKICIAEGKHPVDGKDAKLNLFFEIRKEPRFSVNEDGSINFRELNIISNIRKGELLCTITPPEDGVDGYTVTGRNLLAAKGKAIRPPVGKNVILSDDGLNIFAAIDGKVEYEDGKISVFATYEVPANVDNSTGNIKFIGNVLIRGNVLAGFEVEAGGTVEVWGTVESAKIKAGGDIILHRGIQGMGKGILESGGNIVAKYIEHSIVTAKGSVTAEAIMHSKLTCKGKLELGGKKGLLVGGTYKVGTEITAKVIGSYLSTFTDIEVGADPEERNRYKEVCNELKVVENEFKKTEQAIRILRSLESAGTFTPEKQSLLVRSIRTRLYLQSKIIELKKEKLDLETRLQNTTEGKVRCYNFLYPGTKLTIGNSTLYVKDTIQYCVAFNDGNSIKIVPMA